MLNRVHYGHDPISGLLAVATGSQTVEVWRLSNLAADSNTAQHQADITLATRRSAIRGLCFIDRRVLLTVHATGAMAAWQLPEEEADGEADLLWETRLDVEPCAFAVGGDFTATQFRAVVGGKRGHLAVVTPCGDGEPQVVRIEDAHRNDITDLEFSPDASAFASAGRDRLIKVWKVEALSAQDASSEESAQVLEGSEAWPLCLEFSTDGTRLVSGSMDNGVYLWDTTGESEDPLLAASFEHHGWVVDVAFSPDGRYVAAASWDNTVGIYDAETLAARYSYEYHRDYVSSLYFVPDSPHLISGSYDEHIGVWDWKEARLERFEQAHADWILDVAALGDGRFVTLSSDKTTRLWDADTIRAIAVLGESVSGSFSLGADAGMEDFVEEESVSAESDARQLESERPADAERAVRAIERRDEDDGAPRSKTAMGMLENVLDDEATLDSAEAIEQELDAAAELPDEEAPEAKLDDALDLDAEDEEAPEAKLDDALDLDAEDEGGEKQGFTFNFDFGDDDDELTEDDLHVQGSQETFDAVDALSEASIDVIDDASGEGGSWEDFLDNAPDDLGLDVVSSAAGDERSGESAGQADTSDANRNTQVLDASHLDTALAADRHASEARSDEEKSQPSPEAPEDASKEEESTPASKFVAKAGLKKKLKASLDKLSKRRKRGPKPPEDSAPDDGEDEPGAGSSGELGREVTSSHLDLEVDPDVLAAYDELMPEPDEPAPPSLNVEQQPETTPESAEPIVDEAFGNQTQLGMLSEAGDAEIDRFLSSRPQVDSAEEADDEVEEEAEEPVDEEFGNQTQIGMSSEAEETPEEPVDDGFGNQTQIGMSSEVEDDAEPSNPQFDANSHSLSQRSGTLTNARPLKSESGSGAGDEETISAPPEPDEVEEPPVSKGLARDAATDARALRLSDDFETSTREADEDPTGKVSGEMLAMLRSGKLGPSSSGRLAPGNSERSDLVVPDVSDSATSPEAQNDGPEVLETDLSDMWSRRSPASAPGMGIIRRPVAPDSSYRRVQEYDGSHPVTYGVDVFTQTKLLVSCGGDETVTVWGFDGEPKHHFKAESPGINDVIFSHDGTMVYAGGDEGLVHVWLLPQKTLAKAEIVRHAQLVRHDSRISSLDISSNGKVLLSGSFDATACAWNLQSGELGTVLEGHEGPVSDVAFGNKGLMTVGHDGSLRVWNPAGLQIDHLDGFGKISSLDASPAGYAWATAAGRVSVTDEAGTRELVPHDDEAVAVDILKDGSVASAGKDGRVHLYAPGAREPFQTLEPGSPAWTLRRSGDYLAVGTDDGKVYLYKRS